MCCWLLGWGGAAGSATMLLKPLRGVEGGRGVRDAMGLMQEGRGKHGWGGGCVAADS
jgi:hypothetical protein